MGAGRGISTRWFYDHGVDALCIEGAHDAITKSYMPQDRIIEHDFSLGACLSPALKAESKQTHECTSKQTHEQKRKIPPSPEAVATLRIILQAESWRFKHKVRRSW